MSWGHHRYNNASRFCLLHVRRNPLENEGWTARCKSSEDEKGGKDGTESGRNKGTWQGEKEETRDSSVKKE